MFTKQTDSHYTFEICRHTQPKEVSNLWELRVKTPNDDKAFVLVDADSLSTVVSKINYIMERDGF